ncbi:MAG: hypothetical protein KGL74_14545, partial [Elusimicrobia bacterium]|nr:hypothetical protein [Elusimicrobiota bacterium]
MRRALVAVMFFSSAASAGMTVAKLPIPGTPDFVRVAKDVIAVRIALDPSLASGDGLFDDAARVPSFGPVRVDALHRRLEADVAAMRTMPWRTWPVDRQIDFRWVYAVARELDHRVTVEKLYAHRPASWLEPVANDFINLLTYAPERTDLRKRIWPLIPPMTAEMRALSKPTARD